MKNNVERKQAIGIVLLLGMLLVYMFYFSSSKSSSSAGSQESDSTARHEQAAQLQLSSSEADSLVRDRYGVFAELLSSSSEKVVVETEDLQLHFSTKSGQVQAVQLNRYLTHDQQPLWLVDSSQSHLDQFFYHRGRQIRFSELYFRTKVAGQALKLSEEDTLQLRFIATLSDSSQLIQRYSIPGRGYVIKYVLQGLAPYANDGQLHIHWRHNIRPMEKDVNDLRQKTSLNYYLSQEGLQEIEVLGVNEKQEVFIGEDLSWVALKEKFFLLGLLPEGSAAGQLSLQDLAPTAPFLKAADIRVQLSARDANHPPSYRMYFGPNDQSQLQAVTPGFTDNVYLGWSILSWINESFFSPLFHMLLRNTNNYGLIIVILVFVIRVILFPLTYRSYIGMAKMKVLKPEVDQIKAHYPDDSKKQQSETMLLYQQAGINPLSGCVPLVLQMPVLFAMFYFFPNMIDFRQASFLWAEDLSSYDSVLDLPFRIPMYGEHVSAFTLLMSASTILYTMTNAQVSNVPTHMKVVQYIMPVIFLVFLNSYSSGLTFYYFVSNLVAMGQQMLIKHFVDDKKIHAKLEANKQKNKSKKKTSFQQRLEEAMKQQQQRQRK